MKRVFKYPIPVEDEFRLELPVEAQILTVQVQGNRPYLWALVDPAAPHDEIRFRLAGTGHPIEEDILGHGYIGTFQLNGGALVFHVFQIEWVPVERKVMPAASLAQFVTLAEQIGAVTTVQEPTP